MKGNRWEAATDVVLASVVGAIALVVYVVTLTPTVPFWDSGEFIATAHVLGIPHPPGTPLYVLLGRVFSILPIAGTVAERVNMLSAIPSAIAVALTYLVTARILAGCGAPFAAGGNGTPRPSWFSRTSAAIAGLVMAFSSTFWANAIEAEVYALSSMVMVGCVYLMLKWRDLRHLGGDDAAHASNVVVVVFYLLALSIAFHMGAFVVFLPLVLYFLSDYYKSLRDPRFVTSAIAIVALSFFLGFDQPRLLLSGLLIAILLLLNMEIVGWRNVAALVAAGACIGVGASLLGTFGPSIGLVLAAGITLAAFWLFHAQLVRNNLGFWVAAVFVLGLSVHVFLLIRAGLNPSINEADPSTLENFWLVLSRDQYKPGPPWEFRGDLETKFVTHFWRYWKPQYDMGSRFLWAIPFVLGVAGAWLNVRRSKRTFLLVGFLVFATSVGFIWHLNFKADEVRDRDYFFVALFHFFAIWIGMGAAGIVYLVRESFGERQRVSRAAMFVAAALLLLMPFGQLRAGWFEHDRRGFYVARDYAYNMLVPLAENAIILTNGDNDTFPLWYLQEVEGIRKDVRVANLSLLNTAWYIRQLRDYEPRVPIAWSDEEIARLQPFIESRTGRIVHVKDLAVDHIVREVHRNEPGRPIYIAVTVPELMGFDAPGKNRLVMEGLAWRIAPTPTEEFVDIAKLRRNLEEIFMWRGLLDERGSLDRSIYRDDNSMKLVQNYAVAYIRLSQAYNEEAQRFESEGRIADADSVMRRSVDALRRAEQFREGFSATGIALGSLYHTIGEYDLADSIFEHLLQEALASDDPEVLRDVPQLYYQRGELHFTMRRFEEAREDFELLVQVAPNQWLPYRGLARSLAALGRYADAERVLEAWIGTHPNHAEALEMRRSLLDATTTPGDEGGGSREEAP